MKAMIVTMAATAACVMLASVARAGIGENYNSRDPAPCPQLAGGAPTVAEAIQLFRCTNEVETGRLYLIDDVRLEIGRARPIQFGDGYPDIDQSLPVYPIRGSWLEYQCTNIKTYPGAGAQNCQAFDKANGVGICYRTNFGDWRCQMQGASANLRPGWLAPPR